MAIAQEGKRIRIDKNSLDPYIFGKDYRTEPPRGWARRYRGRPRRGAGKGPEWNALRRGRKPKALNAAMRKFWAWVKEHEESIHRDQFLANDQGAFDARATGEASGAGAAGIGEVGQSRGVGRRRGRQ